MHARAPVDRTRRSLMVGAVAAAASGGPVLAQQAPAAPAKGRLVWLDMDQQELDAAYDQSKYAPNIEQVLKRYTTNSEAVRARLGAPKRLTYGSSEIEGADLYLTTRPNAPVHVFIHGGAWRTGLAKNYAFQAEAFVGAGAHLSRSTLQRAPGQWRSHANGAAGAQRRRVGLQERGELWRRSRSALRQRPLLGRSPWGRRDGD